MGELTKDPFSEVHIGRPGWAATSLWRTAQSVALAVFIGSASLTIEDAIVGAVRAGGDTDRIAAVAAQLRAASGETLAAAWTAPLPTEEVSALAGTFAGAVGRGAREARRPWWKIF